MNASCQKLLPLYTPEIYDQVIDLPVEKPPLIFISEKEYLELKSEVGYWQAMHKKAISRENKLKQTIKEQEGQIRDLRNRLFGKKSEKKSSSKDLVSHSFSREYKRTSPVLQQKSKKTIGLTSL